MVTKAPIIAINPEKGKRDHGISGRQEFVNDSVASGNMCTNPVAKMTPAAKALVAKRKLESVFRRRQFLPINGIAIPMIPVRRMVAMATNLRMRAVLSSRHGSVSIESQILVDMDSEKFLKKDPFEIQKSW